MTATAGALPQFQNATPARGLAGSRVTGGSASRQVSGPEPVECNDTNNQCEKRCCSDLIFDGDSGIMKGLDWMGPRCFDLRVWSARYLSWGQAMQQKNNGLVLNANVRYEF